MARPVGSRPDVKGGLPGIETRSRYPAFLSTCAHRKDAATWPGPPCWRFEGCGWSGIDDGRWVELGVIDTDPDHNVAGLEASLLRWSSAGSSPEVIGSRDNADEPTESRGPSPVGCPYRYVEDMPLG